MPFTFVKSNCVAAGTFNMFIIQPKWLVKIGVLPSDQPMMIEANLEEPGLRMRSEKLDGVWTVSPTHLIVETEQLGYDCGRSVADVIERLPWTPLFAVGTNVTYAAPRSELPQLDERIRACMIEKAPSGYTLGSCAQRVSLLDGDVEFNISAVIDLGEISVSANVNTPTRGTSDPARTGIEAARRFLEYRDRARRLMAELFGVEVAS